MGIVSQSSEAGIETDNRRVEAQLRCGVRATYNAPNTKPSDASGITWYVYLQQS